ncbi:hypothetical protein DCE94_09240 [Agromyces badenianii]|nr:hypothetical protein DCE94_09240 [Agromyces badenianii]
MWLERGSGFAEPVEEFDGLFAEVGTRVVGSDPNGLCNRDIRVSLGEFVQHSELRCDRRLVASPECRLAGVKDQDGVESRVSEHAGDLTLCGLDRWPVLDRQEASVGCLAPSDLVECRL